jgi:putative hydroxymethylpyrimidine transport system substrate-binding protein
MKSLRPFLLILSVSVCQPASAADKLTVLLDWFVNPNHGPLVVAQEIGAYKRANLDVEFIQPADPTMPPRLVAAGHGDIAINYQPQLYQQVSMGLPLLRIGSLIDDSLLSLETLQGYGITTIADLKGKRIGYNEVGGPANLAAISAMLATANLTPNDVTLINIGTALTTSLLTHRIDAVGVDRNFEHFEMIEKGATPIDFDYTSYGVPPAEQLIMEVAAGTANDPRYPRFLAAVKEGAAYIKAHPEAAWKLFLHAYPDLDNALNKSAWDDTVSHFSSDPAALDRAKYQAYEDFLVKWKVIPAALPLEKVVVQLK